MELFYSVTAANFIGISCSEFTTARLQCVASSLGEKSLELMPLMVSFFEACLEASGADVVVKGHSRLLESPELASWALAIMDLLRDKGSAAAIMNAHKDQPLQLTIGVENEFPCMRKTAVIKAPYKVSGKSVGSIGVIGPTKTDYSRVLPLVKYVSEIAGSILTEVIEN